MGKLSNFIIGAAVGVAVSAVVSYVFGPTNDAEYDATYRSRLDHALAEGRKAAQARQLEMQQAFVEAKKPKPKLMEG
ncbi:MAG: hypothetical protein KDE54_37975 [Caldilineaceae bacterium]|nr:hypothetical protein [Caldilineaceae bacterium]MCB0092553.1 hypothetical protein [Caldilineaceae bacterium]MCB0093757.1 hypothetical protein [Caldilineaceae bacterium]MCB9147355.1 hypothetical protein [Caldilineaceae bacterium]MCB9156408.1 hypothetical protein [Caldilineaceae bacterium]